MVVGRKHVYELNNVQGRYVLRAELIDALNKVIFEKSGQLQAPPPAVKAPGEGGGEGGGEGEHGGGEHGAAKPGADHEPAQLSRSLSRI